MPKKSIQKLNEEFEALKNACIDGNLKQVKKYLQSDCFTSPKQLNLVNLHKRDYTPLHLAIVNGHREIAYLLCEHGAKVSASDKTFNKNKLNLLLALLDLNDETTISKQTALAVLRDVPFGLISLFMSRAVTRRNTLLRDWLIEANDMFNNLCLADIVEKAWELPIVKGKSMERKKRLSSIFSTHFKKETGAKLHQCHQQIIDLFYDVPKCLDLLKDLDAELAKTSFSLELRKKYESYKIKYLKWKGVELPVVGTMLPPGKTNKKHTLNSILLRSERPNGLNKKENPEGKYLFADFVHPQRGFDIVKKGIIFEEQTLCNTSLMHGKLSHRLQVHIIIKAVEKGIIKLPDGVSILDLYKSFAIQVEGTSVWEQLLDLNPYDPFASINQPYLLHTILLGSKKLPSLRDYLFDSYVKKLFEKASLNKITPLDVVFSMLAKYGSFEENHDSININTILSGYSQRDKEVTIVPAEKGNSGGYVLFKQRKSRTDQNCCLVTQEKKQRNQKSK